MMFSTKIIILLACCSTIAMARRVNRDMPGAPKKLSAEEIKEAEETLQTSLTKLAAGEGPSYKISKVNTASTQVVSGTLTKFNVDLIDTNGVVKNCNVSIWSQPWLENGIQVTFKFKGEEKVVKRHSA